MPENSAATKPGSSPVESRGKLQQRHIAGVVYDLIAELGIENVTMRQIAEAANVSLGTITYHFRSKEALIATALEAGYALPDDWDQHKGSPVAQLRRIASSYVEQLPANRWWRFWINSVAMSTRSSELQIIQSKRFDKQRRFWIKLIAEGQKAGEIKPDIPVEETADRMLVEVHGRIILQLMKPGAKMRNAARDAINKMIDDILTGA
jgi:AcrR family transcriptional regulator